MLTVVQLHVTLPAAMHIPPACQKHHNCTTMLACAGLVKCDTRKVWSTSQEPAAPQVLPLPVGWCRHAAPPP
jgi:hypothetical protein